MIEEGRAFSGREKNCCFLNLGNGQFANVSSIVGIDFPDDGRAVAAVDWDQDGDLDYWTSNRTAPRLRFLRNDFPGENHSLTFQLQGTAPGTNRDAIGARLELYAAGEPKPLAVRTVRAGEGFLAQSSKRVVIGLGTRDQLQKVVVKWPGGDAETFSLDGLAVDQLIFLRQGSGKPLPRPAKRQLKLAAGGNQPPASPASLRVMLANRIPMPQDAKFTGFDGIEGRLRFGDRVTLVNLWASWCAPCLRELREISERERELRAAGIDVIALCVDELAEESAPSNAGNVLRTVNFKFRAGLADPGFTMAMQGYHNHLVALRRPLPVPTSFLVDRGGRLAAIYKGQLAVDQLLADVRLLDKQVPPAQRLALVAPRPGRLLEHPLAERMRSESIVRNRLFLAETLRDTGRFADAAAHLDALLEDAPEHAAAWQQLGVCYEAIDKPERAIAAYREAEKRTPAVAAVHFGLGNALRATENFEQAVASYEEALRLNPQFAEALVNLGLVKIQLRKPEEALTLFERALEVRPGFVMAEENLKRLRQLMGGSTAPDPKP